MTKRIAAALCFLVISTAAVPMFARDRRDKCEQRVQKAEQSLDNAVRKHGEHSRQAEQKRQRLEEVRANCRR